MSTCRNWANCAPGGLMLDVEYEGAAEIERAWREGLTPDPLLSVSEWSDRHRMLSSKASAEPGRWRTSRTPYLKAIMDCLSPTSPVERVVFMKAAQLGATEMGSNWIGYVIHHAPGPMMAVWPTVEMAKRNFKQRIDPLIEESAALSELIAPARSRDSGNTILAKGVSGRCAGDDRGQQRGRTALDAGAVSVLDEVDGYPLDVEGEGDAISLAEARTRTFARRKIFIVSTPTISGRAPSSASTKPVTSAATSCRARIARIASGCASNSCAGRRATGHRRPTSARIVRQVDCRAPQDLDAGARRMARDDQRRHRQRRRVSPVVALQPGGLARLARHRRRLGSR